jgi:tRNA threonylcarbamoyladenosine biosynthesis protein TsaE
VKHIVKTAQDMQAYGRALGSVLRGGEVIELVGDVGAGKTTLVKGMASGLDIDEDVQSPSFTISRSYPARDGLVLDHYDFYRLDKPGVMSYELAESLAEPRTITVIEWAETVAEVLPAGHSTITIAYQPSGEAREVTLDTPHTYLEEADVSRA